MKDQTDHAELTELYWDRLSDITAGMLSTGNSPTRPMAPLPRRKDNAIWFITAKWTDIAQDADPGCDAQFVTACPHSKLFSSASGKLQSVNDQKKLEDLWSVFADIWFEDGKTDDDIRLVCFTPNRAEVWATDGKAKMLWEMAKAETLESAPDIGTQGTIHFP